MSGIIGGAGSKSGVIGTTELDYEEGTWTAGIESGGGSFDTAVNCTYTKIGRQVTCHMYLNALASPTGDPFVLNGLPFTSSSSPSVYPTNIFGSQSNVGYFRVASGSNNINLYSWTSAGVRTTVVGDDLSGHILGSVSYFV